MGLPEIRAQIEIIMETVSGIGPVFDYERNVHEWAKIKSELVGPDGKIEWWTIRREKRLETYGASSYETSHEIILRGYRALDDAGSSKTFDARIDAVCDALRPKTTLNGTVQQIENPWQADVIEDRIIVGGVVAHYCEIHNLVEEAVAALVQT